MPTGCNLDFYANCSKSRSGSCQAVSFAPLHTAATPLCPFRQRMTDKFAPDSAANSGEAAAGICKGRQPLTNVFFGTSLREARKKTEFGCAKFISLLCLLNASITQSVNSKLSGGENRGLPTECNFYKPSQLLQAQERQKSNGADYSASGSAKFRKI